MVSVTVHEDECIAMTCSYSEVHIEIDLHSCIEQGQGTVLDPPDIDKATTSFTSFFLSEHKETGIERERERERESRRDAKK